MNSNIRKEEMAVLGDFILTSYVRDFEVIKSKFPKLDETFRDGFVAQLDFVKHLESPLLLKERQKSVTVGLYAEAKALNAELNYLKVYFADASFNSGIVSSLKSDLKLGNIEGAIVKLEGVRQFVEANLAALIAEGMDANYLDVLTTYEVSLTNKNVQQNDLLNQRKVLTAVNSTQYAALFKLILQIATKGKLVYRGSVFYDEYTIGKVVKRMRAAKRKEEVVAVV